MGIVILGVLVVLFGFASYICLMHFVIGDLTDEEEYYKGGKEDEP